MSTEENAVGEACLDSAAELYFPEWLESVLEESKKEGKNSSGNSTFALLPQPLRNLFWNMCRTVGIGYYDGVPALACRIYEQCLHNTMNTTVALSEGSADQLYERVQMTMLSKSVLMFAMCVSLAMKMHSGKFEWPLKEVKNYLETLDMHYDIKTLIKTEAKIYQMIGYKIQLWTSADIVGFLCTYLALPPTSTKQIKIFVNIVELRRDRVNAMFAAQSGFENKYNDKIIVTTLELSAATISYWLRKFQDSTVTDQIADIIKISGDYLRRVEMVISEQAFYLVADF